MLDDTDDIDQLAVDDILRVKKAYLGSQANAMFVGVWVYLDNYKFSKQPRDSESERDGMIILYYFDTFIW